MKLSQLNESGLSRFYSKLDDMGVCIITAFRGEYTKTQNRERNARLLAQLRSLGYSVTKAKGTFIENFRKRGEKVDDQSFVSNEPEPEIDETIPERAVKEDVFIVAPHTEAQLNTFEKTMFDLGVAFDQDSIFLGTAKGGWLVGTTTRPSWPAFKEKGYVGKFHAHEIEEFMTELKGRRIAFTPVRDVQGLEDYMKKVEANPEKYRGHIDSVSYPNVEESLEPRTNNGRYGAALKARNDWRTREGTSPYNFDILKKT